MKLVFKTICFNFFIHKQQRRCYVNRRPILSHSLLTDLRVKAVNWNTWTF